MKKQVITKTISGILAILMLVAFIPAVSASELYGDTDKNGKIDVTMTISEGEDGFYETATGKRLIVEKVSVPYFDLAKYGLEHFYYNPDCYTGTSQAPGDSNTADGIVTLMHVFIWATEKYMCDLSEKEMGKGIDSDGDGKADIFEYISWSQGAGSSFMDFWNGSTNMNYYVNYKYPFGKTGWGSTSDQIVMEDGFSVNLHLIVDGSVMGSNYSFFETSDGTKDSATITEGEEAELTLFRTAGGMGAETTHIEYADMDVYYISVDEYEGQTLKDWTKFGTSDENGKVTLPSDLKAGKYYISSMGEVDGSSEIGPAGFILTVNEDAGEVAYGDVNCDGKINSTDAVLILQYETKILGEVEFDGKAADVNRDGKVNSTDAVLILQYEAKIITQF